MIRRAPERRVGLLKVRLLKLRTVGFTVEFEHRFEPDAPLYLSVRRDDCVLHLSEQKSRDDFTREVRRTRRLPVSSATSGRCLAI